MKLISQYSSNLKHVSDELRVTVVHLQRYMNTDHVNRHWSRYHGLSV
jgi:hypothetical protein